MISDLFLIGILTPGTNLLCFNLLSSTIKFISFEIPKGEIVSLLGPSGVGKTTLTKKIQQKYRNFKISVSHTTRAPRSNEVHGVDYFFVSKEKFQELINNEEFYEYAKIFENYYGTLKRNVDNTILKNDIKSKAMEEKRIKTEP